MLLDAAVHDEAPDGGGAGLAEPVHAVDGLVLDRGRPPRVRQHHLVGRHQVEPHAADGQAGEQDRALRVRGERGERGVALRGPHGAVDARDGVVPRRELRLDDVEEGGPLAEDDGFGAGLAVRGLEDAEQGGDLAAAGVGVDVDGGERGGFAQAGGGAHQAVGAEGLGPAHGAAVLGFDDALDAFVPEHVRARGDDRVVQVPEADGAFFARVDAQLQHVLEGFPVFGRQVDDFLGLEGR